MALATTTQALLYPADWRWNADSPHGTAVTITYSWMTSSSAYGSFRPMNATEQAAARAAMAEWSKVANVTFKEVASGGQIAFGTAALGGSTTGYTTWNGTSGRDSGYKITHADVYVSNSWGLSYGDGSVGVQTMIHEIGHALGLKHTFDTSGPTLSGNENTQLYSVMAYADSPYTPNTQPSTPQLYDIDAVQYLYGANTANHTGNDTYQVPAGSSHVETIWDGGGNDTLSAANQTLAARIDLNAGSFSDIGPYGSGAARNNVTIAHSVLIENAVGGAGADTLTGNAANNLLVGGAGADVLTGGAGADTFGFRAPAEGGDTIRDFVSGTDQLQFDATAFKLAAGTLASSAFVKLAGSFGGGTYASGPAFIHDGAGNLYWEDTTGGVYKIASLGAAALTANDIKLVSGFSTGGTTTTPPPTSTTIVGTDAADTLSGAGGEITMKGGLGSDTYLVNSAGDRVIEYSNQGIDLVKSSVGFTLAQYVENLTLTGSAAINGTGTSWHNVLTGNSANNVLTGLVGNDRLTGGGGADTFKYLSPGDGGDSITDFTTGVDRISLDHTAFHLVAGTQNFAKIATAYTGTNGAGAEYAAGHASLILDSTNTLYYDANGKGAGYTVLATLQPGHNLHASDIVLA